MNAGSRGGKELRAGLAEGRTSPRNSGSTCARDWKAPGPTRRSLGPAGDSSTAAGTARPRGSGPVALQPLARSRRLSPSAASSELKKKRKKKARGQSPRTAAVVAATAGASAVGVAKSRASAPRAVLILGCGGLGCRPVDAQPQGRGEREAAGGPAPHHRRAGRGKEVGGMGGEQRKGR